MPKPLPRDLSWTVPLGHSNTKADHSLRHPCGTERSRVPALSADLLQRDEAAEDLCRKRNVNWSGIFFFFFIKLDLIY